MSIISAIPQLRELNSSLSKKWEFAALAPVYSDIVSADINNDGKKEIIFKSNDEELIVLDSSGKKLWSFSLDEGTTIEKLFVDKDSVRVVCSNPVVADINDDGYPEVLIGSLSGKLYAVSHAGKKLWDFRAGASINSTCCVADIDGDGKKEVVFGCSDHKLYALDCSGIKLWQFETGLEIESGICVADINKDSMPEIIFGSNDNNVYCLDRSGKLVWKFQTGGSITAAPSLGDIHGDGNLYVVVGSHDGFLYVLKSNGTLEWKYKANGKIVSETSLVDINFDKKLEIVSTVCSYEENVLILSNTREKIGSFGAGFWVTSSSIVKDVDHDGNYEIVFGSYDHHLYILTFRRDIKDYYLGELKQEVTLYNTEGLIVGTPCVVDDSDSVIIVANEKGYVIALRI
jgi:outer membrane protein assembly factor BamB